MPSLASAQVSIPGKPHILKYRDRIPESVLNNVPTVTMPAIDLEELAREDAEAAAQGLPPRFGKKFDVSYNLEEHGRWDRLPGNRGRVWRLRIVASGASAINLAYDDFFIPKGGRLFIYNQDFSHIIGAFTPDNNREDGQFATGLVYGDTITLGYYEPNSVRGQSRISIDKVVHAYRLIPQPTPKNFKPDQETLEKASCAADTDGDCNISAACPEADAFENELNSAALIILNNDTWGTGTLVANTSGSKDQYVLTTNTALLSTNPNIIDDIIFYWNYTSGSGLAGLPSSTGADILARSSSNSFGVEGSDFALLSLQEDPIQSGAQLYFAGWDARTNASPTDATSVHHYQSGKLQLAQKASNSTIPVTTFSRDSPSATRPTAFWAIDNWDNGAVDVNGAPLFDDATNRLIGTYSGGTAICNGTGDNGGSDYFGQLSYGWNNNGATTANRRLRDWLDPNNTGIRAIDGYGSESFDCSSPAVLACGAFSENTSSGANNFTQYDNLTGYNGKETVHTFTPSATGDYTITLSGLSTNLDLFVLSSCDPLNNLLDESTNNGTANESITITLTAATTYFIIVDGGNGSEGSYTLNVNCPDPCTVATNIASGFLIKGSNQGAKNVYQNYNNSLSNAYTSGEVVYEFTTTGGNVTITFDSLTADLDWFLLSDCSDPQGSVEALNNSGNPNNQDVVNLSAGTYSLVIDGRGGVSGYEITIDYPVNGTCSMPITILDGQPTLADNTNNGQNIIEQYGTQSGWTGEELVYIYQPEVNGPATFTLSNLSANLDLFLLNGVCQPTTAVLASSTTTGTSNEVITETLFGGNTYYLIVDGFQGASSSFLLSLDNAEPCDEPDPLTCEEDPNNPFFFGVSGTTTGVSFYNGFNGGTNYPGGEKVYRFFADAGTVTINLENLQDNLDLFLVDACNPASTNILAQSRTAGTADESITTTVSDGSYFIFVESELNVFQIDFLLKLFCTRPTVTVNIDAFLEGAYNGFNMRDALRRGQLPTTEPFTDLGYPRVSNEPREQVNASVFNVGGSNAITDWVLIELRDKDDESIIVKTQAALLQRDGDVVDLDGVSNVDIQIDPGEYFVRLRSVNHLDVMSAQPISLTQ